VIGRSRHLSLTLLWSIGLLLAVIARPAAAASPYLYVPTKEFLEASPAHRYANMTNAEVFAELDRRAVPYRKVDPIKGVKAPVRLTGKLHGVHVHSSLPEAKRATSIFENLDARLALTLDDFCALLERHDIVEVVHYTMYRPNVPKPGTKKKAKGKGKSKTTRPGGRKGKAPAKKKAPAGTKTPEKKKGAQTLGKGSQAPKKKTTSKAHPKKQKGAPKKKGKAPESTRKTTKKKSPAKPASATKGSSKKTGKKATKGSSKKTKGTAKRKRSAKGTKGRRPGNKKRSKRGKPTKQAKQRAWAPPGTRHPAGLAIDVGGLRKRDGRWLSVAHHFNGRIGARTCGATAKPGRTPAARELRSIVCEAADLGLFTYVLTPNYDAPHADHFHMEIRGDVRWFLYH